MNKRIKERIEKDANEFGFDIDPKYHRGFEPIHRIEEAKKLFNQGDFEGSAIQLRRFREALERYESRLH